MPLLVLHLPHTEAITCIPQIVTHLICHCVSLAPPLLNPGLITGVWCTLTIEHFVFFIMGGFIVEMLSCCSVFIMLCNGLKMSEYEAYCLTDFPLIIGWARAKKYIDLSKKSKQTNKHNFYSQ